MAMGSNFYCRQKTGEVTSDPEYWKYVDEIWKMDIPESEKRKLMDGPECKEQCFDCMAIVGERRIKTQKLID